jgi:hypothetical protein
MELPTHPAMHTRMRSWMDGWGKWYLGRGGGWVEGMDKGNGIFRVSTKAIQRSTAIHGLTMLCSKGIKNNLTRIK